MEEGKMATFTAQILVGQKHPYDGGITNLSHTLYLSENSRPAWILSVINGETSQKITWIPTIEHMLEDALVMIGLYVLKDPELLSTAMRAFKDPNSEWIELYDDISPEDREALYKQARKINSTHKICLSIYQGSTLSNQLNDLAHYQNDIEVCQSIYKKEYSLWNNRVETNGKLEEKDFSQ